MVCVRSRAIPCDFGVNMCGPFEGVRKGFKYEDGGTFGYDEARAEGIKGSGGVVRVGVKGGG